MDAGSAHRKGSGGKAICFVDIWADHRQADHIRHQLGAASGVVDVLPPDVRSRSGNAQIGNGQHLYNLLEYERVTDANAPGLAVRVVPVGLNVTPRFYIEIPEAFVTQERRRIMDRPAFHTPGGVILAVVGNVKV